MDNVNSVSIKGNNCYLPWMEWNATKAFFRTQTMLGDSEKLCGWDLLTHGGFLTYPHHNAAGLCTYVTMQSGSKIWGYLDTPNSHNVDEETLFRDLNNIFHNNINLDFMKYKVATILLQHGDTL